MLHLFLNWEALLAATHVLDVSWKNCCNVFHMRLPLKTTWKLQLVQDIATAVILSVSWYVHITLLLYGFHCFPVGFWLTVTFKGLQGLLAGLPNSSGFCPSHNIWHSEYVLGPPQWSSVTAGSQKVCFLCHGNSPMKQFPLICGWSWLLVF